MLHTSFCPDRDEHHVLRVLPRIVTLLSAEQSRKEGTASVLQIQRLEGGICSEQIQKLDNTF